MAKKQTRLPEQGMQPGGGPEKRSDPYVPDREEPGTSEEIVQQGRIDYAEQSYPRWPKADSARQYIATPEGMQEIQHGVVTWDEEAQGGQYGHEDIERRDEPGHKRRQSRPPDLEL